ncbi:MAG: hypothetical protein KGL39_41980 [Patescibacteria group bacterium]|nr:hypothetical protein [Patescibacteria group bacterium]
MNNYEGYKFWLDIVVSICLPFIGWIVGLTLNRLNRLGAKLEKQTEAFMAKVSEIERKIDERDERMRMEFNARFLEERQLVYRLLDAIKGKGHNDG